MQTTQPGIFFSAMLINIRQLLSAESRLGGRDNRQLRRPISRTSDERQKNGNKQRGWSYHELRSSRKLDVIRSAEADETEARKDRKGRSFAR
jgi:hypothetical protein